MRWVIAGGAVAVLIPAFLIASCGRDDKQSASSAAKNGHSATAFVDLDIPVTTGAAAGYVPDQACADCHQALYRSYQHVAMANSLYRLTPEKRIEDFQANNRFFHEDSKQHFQMIEHDGEYVVRRYQLDENGREIHSLQQRIDWVIGSGSHVRSYVYRNESGEVFQLPIAWYTQKQRWGMAPGYHRPDHQGFVRPIGRECLFCHNAYPDVPAGSDMFGQRILFPEKLPEGIGCQRCHGPGAEHIRLANMESSTLGTVRAAIVNPAKLDPRVRDDVCLQCHLEPTSKLTSIVRTIDRADYSYRPGQPLDEFAVYIDPDDAARRADRFDINHHAYRLRRSTCYTASGGKLNCLTCHDPHVKIAQAEAAAHYRDKCLTCHAPADCGLSRMTDPTSLPESFHNVAADDCVTCHMPKRVPDDVVHVVMTDHRIQRQPRALEELPASKENEREPDAPREFYWPDRAPKGTMGAILVAMAALKDGKIDAIADLRSALATAKLDSITPSLYLGLIEAREKLYPQAVDTLAPIVDRQPDLAEAQLNLGIALRETGRVQEAEVHLRKALELGPDWADAHHQMGLLMSALGRGEESLRYLNDAVRLRPNHPKIRLALANELARQKRHNEAIAEFDRTLAADPNTMDAYLNMGYVFTYMGRWAEAVQAWRRGAATDPRNAAIAVELAQILLTPPVPQLFNAADGLVFARRAAEQSSTDANARALLAFALLMNQRFDEAISTAGESAAAGADEASCKFVIALARHHLGQTPEARRAYEEAQAAIGKPATGRIRPFLQNVAAATFQPQTKSPLAR